MTDKRRFSCRDAPRFFRHSDAIANSSIGTPSLKFFGIGVILEASVGNVNLKPVMTEHAHEIAHPHDLLVRFMLADPELAASLLANYVESRTVQLLDLKRLRCESPVNVDKNLVEIIGDLRFSTVFKKSKRQSNVFVFLAHQSTIDDLMSFRALEEVVRSYREYIETLKQKGKGRPKSFPYPLVVILYHGKRAWGKLKRMRDMIEGDQELAKDFLDIPIFLIDLSPSRRSNSRDIRHCRHCWKHCNWDQQENWQPVLTG